jgi:hypothetical protein
MLDGAMGSDQRHGDEIAGEHDQFGLEAIDRIDAEMDWLDGEVLVVVEIAQLGDGEAVECGRQAPKRDFETDQVGAVGFAKSRSSPGGTGGNGRTPSYQKFSSRDWKSPRNRY